MNGSAVHEPRASGARTGSRKLPIGAEVVAPGRVHFRVWAPAAERVEVVFAGGAPSRAINLVREQNGYFAGTADAVAGDRYHYRLNGGRLLPDPASRFQPEGPHGPSEIVDPRSFTWSDDEWRGVPLEGQIIYELHPGTFTREGTWTAAARELPELAALGITVIELMPVCEFDGAFGWGYDGVDLFAPYHHYGRPDDLRRFINDAHGAGLGVILDVVYNHLGPSGNYLREFAPAYFTDKYDNEWGDAINFDGPDAAPVREFFVANAGYWIEEFHFDGLRLDATQQIFDDSPEHIIAAVGARVRASAPGRQTLIVAENEPQDTRLVRPVDEGGLGLDALWNDDFHHSATVALTGRAEAYYSDTRGQPQEFISAAKYGYLFQGQYYAWQRQRRGSVSIGIEPPAFVVYLENHDQVANSARGLRGHEMTSPARWRAMTAVLLLWPGTPMLFQGQEFSSSAPFLYFADHEPELAAAVRKGRGEFLMQFPSVAAYRSAASLDDPAAVSTFERSKLDFAERVSHASAYALHRDLIALRRSTAAFARQKRSAIDGAVIGPHAFILRFFAESLEDDRVLLVNLGVPLTHTSIAEPLLAPPPGCDWHVEWASEDPAYGGGGTPPIWPEHRWCIPGDIAIVLSPASQRDIAAAAVKRRTA